MDTSQEVADWGERWLAEWVRQAGSSDERETRKWLATHWRDWSLEKWAYWTNHDRLTHGGKSFDEFQAAHAAHNQLATYLWDRNGLFVWRAYREYRLRGQPIPEIILAKLDQFADRLEAARTQREVASALEIDVMAQGYKRRSLQAQADARSRFLDIISDVQRYLDHPHRRGPKERVYERVAQERNMTKDAVKKLYHRWASLKKASPRSAVSSVFRLGQIERR